ncbi:MAG: HD domain-containing protein [Candidatus Gastranaerophilaceae bacterium]
MNKQIKEYIENNILPQYHNFDKGHNIDHVKTVIEESLKLADGLEVNTDMVYTIAAYHDLGLLKDRKTHHLVSGEILQADKELTNWFTNEQIYIMKQAVEDHRASSKSEPRSIYGKIVAEADRDIKPLKIIRRTIQFSMNAQPNADKETYWQHLLEHMKEKYEIGGYMKLWFENSPNASKLEELRKIIADKKHLREIFEQLYREETELTI